MKKLDVYVEEYKQAEGDEEKIKALTNIMKDMLLEVGEEMKRRNARQDAAACAVIDEQNARWQAFLRRIFFSPERAKKWDGEFMIAFASVLPEAHSIYKQVKERRTVISGRRVAR